MKQLNGLGGFVAATLLLMMATSMITATVAEIKPAGMGSKNSAPNARVEKVRNYDLCGAYLNGQGSIDLCEALAIDTASSTAVSIETDRCMLEAIRATVSNARWSKPAELGAGIANASTC